MKIKALWGSFFCAVILIIHSPCDGEGLVAKVVEPEVYAQSSLSVVSMNRNIIGPIIDIYKYPLKSFEESPLLTSERTHPLLAGCAVLNLVREAYMSQNASELSTAKKYLDWLAESHHMYQSQKQSKIWQYNYAHNNLAPGWWSGMGNAAIALAFRAGYEVFHEPRYRLNYEQAMNGILLPVEESGCTIRLGPDAHWVCEYVWPGMDEKNSYFVLNGSLMAMLSVKIMADVTGDERYKRAYFRYINGYKTIKEQFFRKDDKWTYYMLNPLTTEASHYAIYELKLFDALYEITHDDFYLDDISRRRKIFKESYPVHVDQENQFLFSLIGLPNPYFIDVFPITIDFISKGKVVYSKNIKNIFDKTINFSKRAFLTGQFRDDSQVDSFVVKSFDGGGYVELFSSRVDEVRFDWQSALPMPIKYTIKCNYDANCISSPQKTTEKNIDHLVNISPGRVSNPEVLSHYTNSQARIVFGLDENVSIQDNKYIAFIVNSDQKIKNLKFTIFDKKGKSISRYYPSIIPHQDNVLLISFIGFNKVESFSNNFNILHVTLFTRDLEDKKIDDFSFAIKNVFLLKNNAELFSLLGSDNYFLIEKE
ncbi:D-glucuronyl C5-epimerase family protein [Desulfogranum japonicum]|uniref:D-glucuronyl C5-epimerase family protein n=1 Tax=Desulfogranum japonicum TaxID=231447 RepID=UPI00040A4DA0|nr:D-glucuronyl C5-epimerase family protein [Desulfogranum japonicum]